ncbi:MAG: TIR domain-containing protein, partial [Promethearchaeota archaeon]
EFNDGGITKGVYFSRNLVYVADRTHGLEIIDIGLDNDDDGLTNVGEYFIHSTNLTNPDTDGDNINDYDEINTYSTDPNDADSDDDNLEDGLELTYNTDPNDGDSDDDGLLDGDEINIYSTDPNDDDHDDDGIFDGEETIAGLDGYITDPTDNDCDDDGLLDGAETITYLTNPLNADSDYDDLPDGWEVQYSLNPNSPNRNEDPDVDGLTNYEEFQHGTDPRLEDTDGDGYSDGAEVAAGTDPLDPNNFPFSIWDFFRRFGLLIGIAVVSIAIVAAVAIRRKSIQAKKLRVFISHAVDDFRSYRIADIAKFLESQKEISHVYYCEEDLVGNIDDWMKKTVPRCQLLIFFSTDKSLNSNDCMNEINLARKHGLQITPVLGINLRWEDLEKLNVNRELGKEFDPMQFDKLCKELYAYALKFKEDLEKEAQEKKTDKKRRKK